MWQNRGMIKSVLIIGGGIAGLSAARELARHQLAVTVVEAQNRLGGRIRTIPSGLAPVELGAEFVHGESPSLFGALAEAKLTAEPVSDQQQIFEHGKLEAVDIWDKAAEVFDRISPEGKDQSFERFLRRQKDLDARTKRSLRYFVEGFNAAHADRISSQALRRAEKAAEKMSGARQYRPAQGYGPLVEFLAGEIEKLGGTVVTGSPVRHLEWRSGHVQAALERDGQPDLLTANAAVVTVPLGVWQGGGLSFAPPLPEKFEFARGLEFGNVVKVIFVFQTRFWNDFGFVHALGQAIPTWWNHPRAALLTGWAGGTQADLLLRRSPGELEDAGLRILGRIFSSRAAQLRSQLTAMHYCNWAGEPHIRGAYSSIPVNSLDLPPKLGAPVAETLFFAGEATVTDAQMGTVFGALDSGLRAAREILELH